MPQLPDLRHLCTLGLALLLAACASAPDANGSASGSPSAAAAREATREGQRLDDRRPDAPTTLNLAGLDLELTGSWEITNEKRANFDLNNARARDRRVVEHEVKLEARTRPAPDRELFVQAVGLRETRHTEGSAPTRTQALERGQMWFKMDHLRGTPWALQVGRVALIDRRAFWWDDDLDAVRALYNGERWRLDTGFGREVARVSSSDSSILAERRGVHRWFGQASWKLEGRHVLDGFWLLQRDRSGQPAAGSRLANEAATDPSDFKGRWLGLRASGEFRPEGGWRSAYWVDSAWVRGNEQLTSFSEQADGSFVAGASRTRRVRGRALDMGLTVAAPLPLRPALSLAYARGSGGGRDATLDNNFRQTGLHENKARLAGVKRLRSYGEVLQPDLSNLRVLRLGAGLRVLDNSSVELVRHRFRQGVASDSLPGSRLATDPLGLDRDIGVEWNLVLAFREWRQLEFTLKWSHFAPGEAFAPNRRDPARALELGATLNF